jgi:hypothetical protein
MRLLTSSAVALAAAERSLPKLCPELLIFSQRKERP